MGTTDKHPDGVETYPADQHDLDSYRQAAADLAKLRIPTLLHADNPHERLYVAALDGTGNSIFDDDPKVWSVVARMDQQIRALKDQGITSIASGYVEGTFTQNGLLNTPKRLLDGRYGVTFEDRVETGYYQLCVQAKTWLGEDPQAQIRVAGVGFSRGAEEVAALQRMVEERGIRDPIDARVKRDSENLITRIEYANRPPLVPPGKTLQVALLFDPVAEGVERFDRRLPSSTMTTFLIGAEDEPRDLFKINDHIPRGFSEEDRNLNVTVGGAHSDVGNTYGKNGLGVLSFNLGVEFLNRISDRPYLQKQAMPDDPAQFVVHRSEQGMHGLYGTSGFDKDGLRDHVADQSPQRGVQQKDPISAELETQVERRTAPVLPSLGSQSKHEDQQQSIEPGRTRQDRNGPEERSFLDGLIDRLHKGAIDKDDKAMSAAVDDYLRSPPGQQFRNEVGQRMQAIDAQERQMALESQQLLAPQTESVRNPHVMRM